MDLLNFQSYLQLPWQGHTCLSPSPGPGRHHSLSHPVPLQYLGSRTSEKVKSKILELLYSWTVGLPEEVKIAEAYQMLKKQGEAHGCLAPAA